MTTVALTSAEQRHSKAPHRRGPGPVLAAMRKLAEALGVSPADLQRQPPEAS
jgi:hypothetical protein